LPAPPAGGKAGGRWTSLAFAVVGDIHLMPIAPIFVPKTLTRLYSNPSGALLTHAVVDLIALPPLAFAAWTTLARS